VFQYLNFGPYTQEKWILAKSKFTSSRFPSLEVRNQITIIQKGVIEAAYCQNLAAVVG
jgi:hypothetical protein